MHLEREGVRLLWAAPNIDTIKPQVFRLFVALRRQPLVVASHIAPNVIRGIELKGMKVCGEHQDSGQAGIGGYQNHSLPAKVIHLNLSNVWITKPKAAAWWLAKFSYPIAMAMTTDGNRSPRPPANSAL